MNRGLSLFALVLIPSMVSSCTEFTQQRKSEGERNELTQREKPRTTDYIWMEYTHRDRPLQYWMRIAGSGDVWYLRYDTMNRIERGGTAYPRILECKSGRVSSEEIESLFELIEEKGFFREAKNQNEKLGVISEDDIAAVCVKHGDSIRTLRGRPPSHISPELQEIVASLRAKITDLQEDGRSGVFLKAKSLESDRVESLSDAFQFISYSEEQLEEVPYLSEAIKNPGQFVHAQSWGGAEIERYATTHSFFLVSSADGDFQIDVFVRDKP